MNFCNSATQSKTAQYPASKYLFLCVLSVCFDLCVCVFVHCTVLVMSYANG